MAFFCMSLNLAAQNKVTLSFESEVLNSNVHVYTTLGSDPEKEVMPEEDTGSYIIDSGCKLRVSVVPEQNYVVYVWKSKLGDASMEEINESYSATEQTFNNVTKNLALVVDVVRLVPVTFVVPEEGTNGPEVNVEEQGDFGRVIKAESDGKTYLLPENRGAYFDPCIKDGYNILAWSFGEGAYFPARPDQFYKNNVPEDFFLTVLFYKDGETRTVTYEQPKTAVLTCKNRNLDDSPELASGETCTPGDHILFEVAPEGNPDGKVELHHWLVNGEEYRLSDGDFYVDNSLTLMAISNLDVKVVPMEEYTDAIQRVATPVETSIVTDATAGKINVTTTAKNVFVYNVAGKLLAMQAVKDQKAEISVPVSMRGETLIVRTAEKSFNVVFK